jgi:hypothetical protein
VPEPRYRGESWQRSLIRADLEAADAERQRRAEAEQGAAARAVRPVAAPEATPSTPNPAPPQRTPEPRRTWRDLSPTELNRFALAPTESRQR